MRDQMRERNKEQADIITKVGERERKIKKIKKERTRR